MPRARVAPPLHTCPRCGYDLAGTIQTWNQVPSGEEQHAYPLEGLCSECGLAFEWKYIFTPELAGPLWFVESPRVARWAKLKTMFRACVPWIFWRGVRLEIPFRFDKAISWCVIMMGLPLALLLSCRLGAEFYSQYAFSSTIDRSIAFRLPAAPVTPAQSFDLALVQMGEDLIEIATSPSIFAWLPTMVVLGLGVPGLFLLLPFTRATYKVRAAHVARATFYSFSLFAVFCAVSILCELAYIAAIAEGTHPRDMSRVAFLFNPLRLEYSRLWTTPAATGIGTLFLFTIAWFAAWWGHALYTGFRMKESAGELFACLVPPVLVLILILVLYDQRFIMGLI